MALKSVGDLTPHSVHITHASFGSIRWCVPTARWMDHVVQAHGLGRTGVGGVVNPESATARLTSSCGRMHMHDRIKATWLSIAGLGKALSGHAPSEAMGRTYPRVSKKKN